MLPVYKLKTNTPISEKHVMMMKIVRSCMTSSKDVIEYGIRHSSEYSIHDFQIYLDKIEQRNTLGRKKRGIEYRTESDYYYSFISTKHAAVYVIPNFPSRGELSVVFRQSYCKCNWVSNLQWVPRDEDGIHSGFYHLSSTLMPFLRKVFSQINQREYSRFYFSGMSLGGALCALTASRLTEEKCIPVNKVRIVQIASPRIGTSLWQRKYMQMFCKPERIPQSFHYHSNRDFFAYSPPDYAGPFKHVGVQIYSDDFGQKGYLTMIAHSKIYGMSYSTGSELPLCISMIYRGNQISKHWKKIAYLLTVNDV